MTSLPDVNVLIALIDPAHVAHDAAHRWFDEGRRDWATCPLTENGVVRIVGHPKYPNCPGSPAKVTPILARLRGVGSHTFWPDEISLVDSELVSPEVILTSGQVTDTYLLALAAAHNGRLVTFDRRLSAKAVRGGASALQVLAG